MRRHCGKPIRADEDKLAHIRTVSDQRLNLQLPFRSAANNQRKHENDIHEARCVYASSARKFNLNSTIYRQRIWRILDVDIEIERVYRCLGN